MNQSQQISLKQKLEQANESIAELQQQLAKTEASKKPNKAEESKEVDGSDDDDDGQVMEHVKVTLMQYL